MFKRAYPIPLKPGQRLRLVALSDIHWDTPECDRARFIRFVRWVQEREQKHDEIVRIPGLGDYLDFGSYTERKALTTGDLHETTNVKIDRAHLTDLREFLHVVAPIKHCFLGLLTGHHHYLFATATGAGAYQGRSSDQWLADQLGCHYWGTGVALIRLQFPHRCHLDVLCWHGGGSAQTYGGRVMRRIRAAEIAPTAHLVISGHDNAKMAVPRSGLDYDHGSIKRYVIGSGSFQRAYGEGPEAGYAEQRGLIPADLGVTVVDIGVEKRNGRYRVDYHASV